HVFIQRPAPRTKGDEAAYSVVAGHHWRKSSSVAQTHDQDAVQIDEVVFRQRVKRSLPTFHLTLEICLGALALALAHTGFIHADSRISRLVNEAAHENTDAVSSIRIRIFHAVATQPPHKEDHGYFASSVVRVCYKRAQLFSAVRSSQHQNLDRTLGQPTHSRKIVGTGTHSEGMSSGKNHLG